MFNGGIELSYRHEPHVQLTTFGGYPLDRLSNEVRFCIEHVSDDRAALELQAFYGRRGFYQVKWWVMVPFSDVVSVDGEPVDVYTDAAAHEYGLEYGKSWTRVKLFPVRNGMKVKVGRFTFTVKNSDIKNLMIYRRLDNSLVELEWIWWNLDRNGSIPRKWFFCFATVDVAGGIPEKEEKPLVERAEGKIRRIIRKIGRR